MTNEKEMNGQELKKVDVFKYLEWTMERSGGAEERRKERKNGFRQVGMAGGKCQECYTIERYQQD